MPITKPKKFSVLSLSLVLLVCRASWAQVTYEEISNLSSAIDGGLAWGGVVRGSDGSLYGAMTQGAEYGVYSYRRGQVYRVAPDGTTIVLHAFSGIPGDGEGYGPFGELVEGPDGNFYGMAMGGNTDEYVTCGAGLIYRVTPAGQYSIVHKLAPLDPSSGNYPDGLVGGGPGGCTELVGTLTSGGLLVHPDGNLYGVTQAGGHGGIPSSSGTGGGVFFRLTTAGEYSVLYNIADLKTPAGTAFYGAPTSLTLGTDGAFYGIAVSGGLFRITTSGQFTPLHEFQGEDRGLVAPIEGDDGNFYGITYDSPGQCVSFYKVTASGTYASDNSCVPGGYSRLRKGSDGNFYWATTTGGSANLGSVQRITPGGVVTVLFQQFPGPPGGTGPAGRLLQVSPGVFYGTTTGSFDPPSGAVVYKLTVNANSAPVAQDDGYQTSEDTALQASAPGVLANDNDADPLQAVLVSGPTHGSLMLNADGSFTYSPAANYNGQDSFTYQASDGQLNSQTATVSIEVVAVNDVPIAAADVATTKKNVSIVISVEGNDTDIDGDALQVLLPSFNTAKKGKVTTDGTTITYTPKKGFTGTDSFTYQVTDGQATSNSATVTVTVTK